MSISVQSRFQAVAPQAPQPTKKPEPASVAPREDAVVVPVTLEAPQDVASFGSTTLPVDPTAVPTPAPEGSMLPTAPTATDAPAVAEAPAKKPLWKNPFVLGGGAVLGAGLLWVATRGNSAEELPKVVEDLAEKSGKQAAEKLPKVVEDVAEKSGKQAAEELPKVVEDVAEKSGNFIQASWTKFTSFLGGIKSWIGNKLPKKN
jgi:hypothetical protein